MNFQSYIHYTSFLVFISLAIYALIAGFKSRYNLFSAIMFLCMGLWSISFSFINNPYVSNEVLNLVINIISPVNLAIGVFMVLAILSFISPRKIPMPLYIVLAAYIIAVITLQIKGYLAYPAFRDTETGYWVIRYKHKLITILINIVHNGMVAFSIFILWRFYRNTNIKIKQLQAGVILKTGLISFILSSANIYLSNAIKTFHLPLYPDVILLIFAFGIVYSIFNHRFLSTDFNPVAQKIIDLMPAGLIITNPYNKITYVNQTLLKLCQIPIEQIIGQPLNLWLNQVLLQKPEQSAIPNEGRFDLVTGNNTKKSIYWLTEQITGKNKIPMGTVCLINDINHLVKTEKKLRELNKTLDQKIHERTHELQIAKEKAEQSDRLKSAFLENMSHEIRTPLNGIIGFSELITENDEKPAEEKKVFLNYIKTNANQLLKIVSDIIEISRIESGEITFYKQEFDVNEFLTQVEIHNSPNFELKQDEITIKVVRSQNNIKINADQDRVLQIFSILLNNALKFTQKGQITYGFEKANHKDIVFFVKDTGIGISQENHDLIFKEFTQGYDNKNELYGGNGIGLSIAKKLLGKMNGHIWFKSIPEGGSVFFFQLNNAITEQKEPKPAPAKPNHKITELLLVEDDLHSRLFISELLSESNYQLSFAKTAHEARERVMNNTYRIILMDVKLPDGNGLELAKEIRKTDDEVFIVAQTAYASHIHRLDAIKAGCNEYISKPINSNLLLEILNRASEKK